MNKIFVALSIATAYLLLASSGQSADTEYQQFLQKERNQFKAFKTGKLDPEAREPTASPSPHYYSKQTSSTYNVLTQPGGGTTPEEQHAWRLYRSYKKTFSDEISARASLKQAQRDARALGYGFGAPFALDPKDVEDIRDAKIAVNKAIELRQKLADAWDRHFGGYYGSLDETSKTYELKASDPHDPLKTHTIKMDKIEYRLRSFPYSQRKGNEINEPQTATVVSTPLPIPALNNDSADTGAEPEATAEDHTGDSDGPIHRVPVAQEDNSETEESASDEAIRVEQPDEDTTGNSWKEMTPEERHQALKDNDPAAWEQIRRDLTGDADASDATTQSSGKSWEEMTVEERHAALMNNDDHAWEAVRAGLKSGNPDTLDAINEALSPTTDPEDDEFTIQDVIDAANRATGKM